MKCFNHQNQEAIGICKACQKAICPSCAIDTGRGLACSDACLEEVNVINEIVDKSKRIYGIGSKPKLLPTGILLYFFFGLMFSGFALYRFVERARLDYFTLAMGLGFLVFGIIAYYKNRKLNLNC